ncbi:MAG TPA: GWxTD domain-containing protein [Terracidiphilus sp.]
MNSIFSRTLASVLILISLAPFVHAADRSKSLPPRYQHWVNEEVNYIIGSGERKQFLALTSDVERDSFIAAFWKIRNPDPGSESNAYRDEHYRRLAYANEHFGSIEAQNGWRSDQGRIYIILGAPKQVVTYPAARNVRPLEIWFYQAPSLALPPYFNLVFYKRSIGEPYALYSPNQDGPARLVSSLEALNDQKRSLDILRKSLGEEVAKTALSLIPGESVDFDDYQPSLSSDVLLATIEGLADNPHTQELLNANRVSEHVTMSVLVGERDAQFSYAVFRDDQGRPTLSYLLRMGSVDPQGIGRRADNSLYYDFALRTSVLTAAGKPVYDQEDRLTGKVTEAQAENAKKKRFAAEARIPLAPGTYTVVATLTNNLNQTASRQHASITVPAVKSQEVGLSSLLAYKAPAAVPDPKNQLPFSVSRLRFSPRGAQSVYLRQGDKLPLVFQLWLDPQSAATAESEKIHLRYVFGEVTASHPDPHEEDEDVDASNRDQAGNLLTGHTLDTSALLPGTYRLVVGANKVGEHQTGYESMTLHVMSADGYVDTWTAYGPMDPDGEALDDFKRGLSAEAQSADTEAQNWYTRSLAEGSTDMRPLDKLAALLGRHEQSAELAALSKQPILVRTAAAPKTLLGIAQALTKTGDPKDVVHMLDAQIKLQQPNVDLYHALADACEATGNTARARELRTLAAGVK